jgi:hypothetical protein
VTLKQYFLLTKVTSISCIKICAFLFTSIATIIAALVTWETGTNEDAWEVFIGTELFGNGLALFIYVVAFLDGYYRAKRTISQWERVPQTVKSNYSLALVRKNLNPKYNFMQFEIMSEQEGGYQKLSELFKIKYLGFH